MGANETALIRLWREKRGEAEPPDYSDNLLVQLGVTTEPLNRRWFEKTTGEVVKDGADPLYQHLLLTAEKKFWRCVQSGHPPHLCGVEPPRARIEAARIVDMSLSNAWAEFAAVFRRTRDASLEHERAKAELKGLVPEDAKEAIGHGIRAKRSKAGALSFDLLTLEGASHASIQ
jgi:hypothetical protein